MTVKLDEQEVKIDVSTIDASLKETDAGFRGFDLDSIIYFGLTDNSITVNIKAGLCGFNQATPFDYVDIYSDIQYNGIEPLSNCRIEYTPR